MRVLLAKDFDAAIAASKSLKKDIVAIETEYGDKKLDESYDGIEICLNHHFPIQDNIPPSAAYTLFKNKKSYNKFIISHVDLDTIFGMLWAGKWIKPTRENFFIANLIAYCDNYGIHNTINYVKELPKNIHDKYLYLGYLVNSWIIHDNGYSLKDITKEIKKLLLRISDVLNLEKIPDEKMTEVYKWLEAQQEQAEKYLIDEFALGDLDIFIYSAPFKLTTAYEINGKKADIIIQLHQTTGAITLSCRNEEIAISVFGLQGVIEPLNIFFGKNAGGKLSIGGSPRNKRFSLKDLDKFKKFIIEYINNSKEKD